MPEPVAQKCENNAISKQTVPTLKLFVALKMDNSCCFG